MNLSQFLPSVHFAISQLKDGSEDAQMHSFYLSKLAAALTPTVVESTPENRQEPVKYLWAHWTSDSKPLPPAEFKREFIGDWKTPEPPTVVVYGTIDIKVAYATAHHYGCSGINFEASMIIKGKLNTVPERPQYEVEGIHLISAESCLERLGL